MFLSHSEQHAVTQKEHNPVTMTTIKQCTPSHIPVVTTITQREQCAPSHIPVVTTITQREQCAPSHIPVVTTITQREQCAPSHIPVVTTSTVNCVSVVSTITQNDRVTVILDTMEMRNTSAGQTASYAGLAGGLGVLTAVMTLLLVSVVLGWVWSCRKRFLHQEKAVSINIVLKCLIYYNLQYKNSDDTKPCISESRTRQI